MGDFGSTKRVAGESSVLHTNIGTRAFKALEILDLDVDAYMNAVDLWSLGCVTYMMLTSKLPFPGHGIEAFCAGRLQVTSISPNREPSKSLILGLSLRGF